MKNVLKGTHSKISLIGKIKGLSEQSKRLRIKLLNRKTKDIYYINRCSYAKYIVGLDVRHHLLAYAYLGGRAYRIIEKKCRSEHKPSAAAILQIVSAHAPEWEMKRGKWTLEMVAAWLAEEVVNVIA